MKSERTKDYFGSNPTQEKEKKSEMVSFLFLFVLWMIKLTSSVDSENYIAQFETSLIRVRRSEKDPYSSKIEDPRQGLPQEFEFDCADYLPDEVRIKHEVNSPLTKEIARENARETFEYYSFEHQHHVWQGPTYNQWWNTNRWGPTCTTDVKVLYQADRFCSNPILVGHDCRIHIQKGTFDYLLPLTVCKRDAKFLATHHCEDCVSNEDIREWWKIHLKSNKDTPPYVLVGPIENFYFYEGYYATHSRMLVTFVTEDFIYWYTNARLLFYGNIHRKPGTIYKMDLSHNTHYEHYYNHGLFNPHKPPGIDTYFPYIHPDPEYLFVS